MEKVTVISMSPLVLLSVKIARLQHCISCPILLFLGVPSHSPFNPLATRLWCLVAMMLGLLGDEGGCGVSLSLVFIIMVMMGVLGW